MRMILSCPVIALLLLSLVADQGAKCQGIYVPEEQPPVFLSHYNYPVTTVSLTYTYLSPNDCPVPENRKLNNINVTVPRGASILNTIEIAANVNPLATFECSYLSGRGYFLTKLNNVPDDDEEEDPLCQWTWDLNPQVFSSRNIDFSVSEAFIPFFLYVDGNPELSFTYRHLAMAPGLRPKSGRNQVTLSSAVLTPESMPVRYILVESSQCSFSQGFASIPATPLTVSIQAGGSALNVMERAADMNSTLDFTISSTFGVLYDAEKIAGINTKPGCQWCLTYQPPHSTEVIVPESNLQNFVIPLPETTLRMEYTSTCLSEFQVALARNNMTYFREKGFLSSQTSKKGCPAQNECCCDGEKSSYSTTFLILAGVLFLSSLLLCTRYFS